MPGEGGLGGALKHCNLGVACYRVGWQLESGAPVTYRTQRQMTTHRDTFLTRIVGDPTWGHPGTMTNKRKEHRKPQCLMDLFIHTQHGGRQDDAGSSATQAVKNQNKTSKRSILPQNGDFPNSPHSYPPTPNIRQPG